MDDTMPFSEFVEINPKVTLKKGIEYSFVEMDIVNPGRRYVSSINKRIYNGGGAKFQFGDTLFARITPCLENGKIAQFSGIKGEIGFGSTEFFVFRNKEGISDAGYIFYLASSDILRKPAEKSMSGASGRQRADIASIKDLEIPAPPLPTQRKIAAILSAYDELIENNMRRIKILEEMAQALYREWFVKFRFPGHEKVKMVESELGMVPEGWKIVSFTNIAEILSGGTPKTKVPEYWGGKLPFFTPTDASTSFYIIETEKSITELGLSKCNSQLYPKDIVFITARGTVGKVVMPAVSMAMNQSCYALRGNEGINQLYLFLTTKSHVEYLKKNTGGATFDTIVIDTFRMMQVIKPPFTLINEFTIIVRPIFNKMLNLIQRNINLRRTRDLLLPKLISGEVDVEKIDVLMA